jgi:hypothetical protein
MIFCSGQYDSSVVNGNEQFPEGIKELKMRGDKKVLTDLIRFLNPLGGY